jgi:phosphoglucomutase
MIKNHWKTFGRNLFTRYDYENVDASGANLMMNYLEPLLPGYIGHELKANEQKYKIVNADNFSYTDPIDGSVTKNQGIRLFFEGGARVVLRLSGTGSAGATVRLYVEKYLNINDPYLEYPAQVCQS